MKRLVNNLAGWIFCFQIKGVTYLYTRAQVAEDTDNHVTLLISNYRKGWGNFNKEGLGDL